MSTKQVHVAKNGRHYVRLPTGQTQFISEIEAKMILEGEIVERKKKRATHHHRSSSSSSPSSAAASVSVRGHAEIDFNERQLGQVLRGFVNAARGDGAPGDVDRMFGDTPAPSREEGLLLDLGRELFGHMPAALAYFDVVSDEWASWFRRPASSTKPGVMPATPPPIFAPVSPLAWLAPVVGRITQRFGQGHSGIDIACPVGTPVVAPVDLRVTKVGFDATAGHFVVADAMRDDGTFKGDGYRVTFAHLSDVDVAQGQTVRRGQVVAQSGATGNATGPHLHFRVEWIDDGLFRDKALAVDPLALIPEAVLSGAAQPQPVSGELEAVLHQAPDLLRRTLLPRPGRVLAREQVPEGGHEVLLAPALTVARLSDSKEEVGATEMLSIAVLLRRRWRCLERVEAAVRAQLRSAVLKEPFDEDKRGFGERTARRLHVALVEPDTAEDGDDRRRVAGRDAVGEPADRLLQLSCALGPAESADDEEHGFASRVFKAAFAERGREVVEEAPEERFVVAPGDAPRHLDPGGWRVPPAPGLQGGIEGGRRRLR
jgi:murein DD-endopeptidase MepM/ murein hydrolase activator NlpD